MKKPFGVDEDANILQTPVLGMF